MDHRQLGGSGLKVPVLTLGTGTFGGGTSEFFKAWGASDVAQASRLVDICLEAGVPEGLVSVLPGPGSTGPLGDPFDPPSVQDKTGPPRHLRPPTKA